MITTVREFPLKCKLFSLENKLIQIDNKCYNYARINGHIIKF